MDLVRVLELNKDRAHRLDLVDPRVQQEIEDETSDMISKSDPERSGGRRHRRIKITLACIFRRIQSFTRVNQSFTKSCGVAEAQ